MKLICIFPLLIACVTLGAQAPQSINYQGALRDLDGMVMADRQVEIRITISSNGHTQFSETHSITTNGIGLFDIAIGEGIAMVGSMQEVEWASGDTYLKTELFDSETGQFVDMGTVPFRSVPYALYANASTPWTQDGDQIFYNQGGVGIGTSSVNHPFEVHTDGSTLTFDNTINANPILSIHHPVLGVGDILVNHSVGGDPTLQMGFGVAQGTNRSVNFRMAAKDMLTIRGTGLVGVNTVNPQSRLHVSQGDVQVTNGDIYIQDANHGVIMKSPNGQCWRMTVSNTGQAVFQTVSCPN